MRTLKAFWPKFPSRLIKFLRKALKSVRPNAAVASLFVLLTAFSISCEAKIGDETSALVNGRPITMETLVSASKSAADRLSASEEKNLLSELLSQLIEEELMVQEAERRGIKISDRELAEKVQEIMNDYPGRSFNEMLIREYIDFEAWKEQLRRNMLIQAVTKSEMNSRVTLTAEEWSAFIKDQGPAKPEPAKVRVEHLTFPDRRQAEQTLKKIRAGQDFDQAARELTDSVSSGEVGRPIWVYPGRLPEPLAETLAESKEGQVTCVVETGYGYSIFKVLEVRGEVFPEPEEILSRLRRQFQERQEAEAFTQWIAELRKQAEIMVNPCLQVDVGSDSTKR